MILTHRRNHPRHVPQSWQEIQCVYVRQNRRIFAVETPEKTQRFMMNISLELDRSPLKHTPNINISLNEIDRKIDSLLYLSSSIIEHMLFLLFILYINFQFVTISRLLFVLVINCIKDCIPSIIFWQNNRKLELFNSIKSHIQWPLPNCKWLWTSFNIINFDDYAMP